MFVRAANPIWFMVDHVGQPLNDEYYAFFLTNTLPYLPQNVYRDPQGMTVWTGDIVQFSPAGTLPDNLYFDPNLVYRIEIRHGNSQMDELIWEINNFVPGEGSNTNNTLAILANDNQITNPQFLLTNFSSPLTISVAGSYDIAPGWVLDLAGAGITILTRNVLDGNQNIINNPPYSLRFNNNGWTSATLRQRFNHNGAIWASGAVTMQLTGRAQTTPELVTMVYAPSSPGVPQVVASHMLTTGDYQVLKGAIDLLASVNTTLSDTAYTDILIQLPANGIVDLTNIQVIGQGDALPSDFDPATDIPLYQQQSNEREIDHTFNVYSNSLIRQAKNSFLVGWNFALNPWQFRSTTLSNVANNTYTADQTIVIQQAYVASATGNNIAIGKGTAFVNYGFGVKAVTIHNQFGILQYIDPNTVRPYWTQLVSSLVNAFTNSANNIQVKMRLFYIAGLPSTTSQNYPVASWTEFGDPVFAAGITALIPENDPIYTLTNEPQDFAFEKFQLPLSSNVNMTLGIFLYTASSNSQNMAINDILIINDVSLVRNDFAIATQPQTFDEVLSECEYYYEKSYQTDVLPGSPTFLGMRHACCPWGGNFVDTILYLNTFSIVYNQIKRAIPAVTIYSPTSTINTAQLGMWDGTAYPAPTAGFNPSNVNIADWSASSATEKSLVLKPNVAAAVMTFTGTVPGSMQGEILYHYVADARLGI